VCLALVAGAAHAQEPPAGVTPPEVTLHEPVTYPPDASGAATVVVELTVAPDGSVETAAVVSGDPPFVDPARP